MNVRILGAAQAEATDAADWYDRQTPGVGPRFLAALDTLVATIAARPRLCPRVRGIPAGREVREGTVPGFPYLAVYEVTADEAVILSVTHGKMAARPWRSRLADPPAG